MAVNELGIRLSGRVGSVHLRGGEALMYCGGGGKLDLEAVSSDLPVASINGVRTRTCSTNHFSLDPGLS